MKEAIEITAIGLKIHGEHGDYIKLTRNHGQKLDHQGIHLPESGLPSRVSRWVGSILPTRKGITNG